MRRPTPRAHLFVLACLLVYAAINFFAQSSGQTQGSPGRTPPARRPESGLRGGGGPTTKPGSHESSAKDERDRIAGKFPAPKEQGEEREAAAREGRSLSTAYVDAVVLDPRRQAIGLTRDDFRVAIDGVVRRVISVHYVFRGPNALGAAHAMTVGRGVVARAEEARTIVIAAADTGLARANESATLQTLEHLLDVIGPADRAAVLALPRDRTVRFASARSDLLQGIGRTRDPAPLSGSLSSTFEALTAVFNDLLRFQGPKYVLLFTEGGRTAARPAADAPPAAPPLAVLDAAAASRSVVHVVAQAHAAVDPELRGLATSTGGTLVRVTGEGRDLDPLAAPMLGGYVLEVESLQADRNGRAHDLSVTTHVRGTRVLAPARWVLRHDALPPVVVR